MQLKVLKDDDFANLSSCERCIGEGGGCCTGEGSGIFVTLQDVLKIHLETGIELDQIAHFEKVDDKYFESVERNDKYFSGFFRDGKILQLKRKEGDCKFLKQGHGCSIFDSRPTLCKFFPFNFEFRNDGSLKILIPKAKKQKYEDCTILADNYYRSKGANYKAMNTNKEHLMSLFQKHVKELEQYDLYADDLNEGVSLKELIEKYKITTEINLINNSN